MTCKTQKERDIEKVIVGTVLVMLMMCLLVVVGVAYVLGAFV